MNNNQNNRSEKTAQKKQEKGLAFHRVLLSVGIMGMASTLTFANLPMGAKTPALIPSDSLVQKSDSVIRTDLNERKARAVEDNTADNFALDSILLNANSSEAARLERFLSKNKKKVDSSELEAFLRRFFQFLTPDELSRFLAFVGASTIGLDSFEGSSNSGSDPTTFTELFNDGTTMTGNNNISSPPDPPPFSPTLAVSTVATVPTVTTGSNVPLTDQGGSSQSHAAGVVSSSGNSQV